jgi:hypothetical protein
LQVVRTERDGLALKEKNLQNTVLKLEQEVLIGLEKSKKHQAMIDQLREELTASKNSEKQARQWMKEGEGMKSRLETLKVKEGAVEELSLQCQEYERNLSNLAEDNSNLKLRVQEVVRLLEGLKELNEDLERENKSIPRLEAQIRLLEALVEERDRKIKEALLERDAVIEETDTLIEKQRHESSEIVELYKSLEIEYSSLKCLKNDVDYQNISLMKRLEIMKEESGMLNGDIIDQKKLSNEIVTLREKCHEQKIDLDKSQMKLEEAERELSILRKKLNDSFRELNKVAELSSQFMEVKDQLELANMQNKTHQKTIQELREIVEEKDQAEYSETLNTRISDRLQIELSERDSHINTTRKGARQTSVRQKRTRKEGSGVAATDGRRAKRGYFEGEESQSEGQNL